MEDFEATVLTEVDDDADTEIHRASLEATEIPLARGSRPLFDDPAFENTELSTVGPPPSPPRSARLGTPQPESSPLVTATSVLWPPSPREPATREPARFRQVPRATTRPGDRYATFYAAVPESDLPTESCTPEPFSPDDW